MASTRFYNSRQSRVSHQHTDDGLCRFFVFVFFTSQAAIVASVISTFAL